MSIANLKSRFRIDFPVNEVGSKDAEIILLVDPANFVNIRQNNSPLEESIYNSLISLLIDSRTFSSEEDILSNIRIVPSLKFTAKDPLSKTPKDREITDADIKDLSIITKKSLQEGKSKVIIACGSIAAKLITDFKYETWKDAENAKEQIDFNGIPVLFFNSIKSVFKFTHDATKRKTLSKLNGKILQAKSLCKGIDPNDVFKNLNYERLDAFDPKNLKKLFDIFLGHSKVVLDYETSGLNTYIEGFHLAGIGLSSMDRTKAVYIRFYDLFRRASSQNPIPEESLMIIREFFKTRDFVVFNKQYECAVTISPVSGINLNIKNTEDVLMWLRCLSASSSLKDACVNRLGVEKWNDGVTEWVNAFNEIIKLEKPTKTMKGQRKEIEWLMAVDKGLFDIEEYFKDQFYLEVHKELKRVIKKTSKNLSKNLNARDFTYITTLATSKELDILDSDKYKNFIEENSEHLSYLDYDKDGKKLFTKKKDIKLIEEIKKIKSICEQYFEEDKVHELSILLKHFLYEKLENHENSDSVSYSEVPIEIMEPYCIADCKFTAMLYYNVKQELEEKNLLKAAEVYNRQGYLGYILARNGIAWDDKLASSLEEEYSKIRIESLRSLITLPKMATALKLNDIALINAKSTTNLAALKAILNPNSSYKYEGEKYHKNNKYRMTKVIGTPRFKLAMMLFEVQEYINQVNDDNVAQKEFPTFFPLYKKIISLESTEDKINFLEEVLKNADEFLKKPFVENMKANSRTKEVELKAAQRNWEIPSLSQEYTSKMYSIFSDIFGIDPNDDSNWPEEFFALYYFKVFKKVEKSIGTYLNGSLGRSSVEIVNYSDLEKECPPRIAQYSDRPKNENEVYINRTGWGVCTAGTKRWQAGQHTVPKSTELMDLRCSRYKDGIKLHYDYSQAEVRVLAIMSGDENLLQAFKDGLDIHLYNAARMWKKDPKDVTSTERSMAKGVTFSLLYGASVSEFANKFTNGNYDAAKKIINSFFASYPKVEEFIKESHRLGTFTGTVPTVFGDPLYVDMPDWVFSLDDETKLALIENPYNPSIKIINKKTDDQEERKQRAKYSKALRNCQNYRIQSSSSTLAGLGMEELQSKIEEFNLSTKLECFTHDSCDADLRIKDLIRTMELVKSTSVDYLLEQYNIPMKIDMGIGVSNNKIVELSDININDNVIKAEFEGTQESLTLLKNKIENNNGKLEYSIEESKESIISIKDLFLTTNAYAQSMGKPFTNLKGELKIAI
ncbi:MAG: hypothetical protein HKO92_02185 [Flavobacteriaceae bacterium]|nr:hypothetical protein [Flavobacteriaceae bacterium]